MEKNEIFHSVYKRLKNELPEYLYYHSPEHTLNVIDRAIFLASQEDLNENEIHLIKIASLYHDAGFLVGRDDHETKSCELAKKELPQHGYSMPDIKKICGMINATRIPQKTHNLNEKIVADADLFYLGTDSYDFYSDQLYKELKHINPDIDQKRWLEIQLDFLDKHSFHTAYAKKALSPVKQKNMEKLLKVQKNLSGGN